MNNIYVDELPKCCLMCKMECPEEQRCVDGFTMDCDYCSVNERPASCPLKPLTDRLAEERKKVVQEIREWCKENFDYKKLPNELGCLVAVNREEFFNILDQIERGE